jgi:hypothetical protein
MYNHRTQKAPSRSSSFAKRVNHFTMWLFSTKQLDLLILASCSCLFTVIYQPIAHAISTSAINANVVMTYPVQFSHLYAAKSLDAKTGVRGLQE